MSEPAQWKIDFVKSLSDQLNNSPVTAVVSIKGLRNKEFQKIRKDVRNDIKIQVVRARLLRLALKDSEKEHIDRLIDISRGQIALITTSKSPKTLFDTLQAKRTKAAARGGEIADQDIVLEAKETSFPPGPMISIFQKAGIPAGIEKGKIVIKSEVTLVKKGEAIPKEKAQIMEKLEILPVTVGLDLKAAYSDGLIYTADVLSVTIAMIQADLAGAFLKAKALAMKTMYIVPEIVPDLLGKAHIEGIALALATNCVDEKNIDIFIRKAVINATALNSLINKDLNNENIEDKDSKEEEKETKKDESEDDASAGLGSLFG
ncbi:MAG: 50S ribosomal protein L10 [Ferroplasma sp.]